MILDIKLFTSRVPEIFDYLTLYKTNNEIFDYLTLYKTNNESMRSTILPMYNTTY